VFLGLAAIVWLVCWILVWSGVPAIETGFGWRDVVFMICLLIAAAASLAIVVNTKKIKTELRDNGSYKPE